MCRVKFLPADLECEVPVPARIIDVTDDHPDTDVPYSCRAATCGTCRVRVEEGADALAPPGMEESEILHIFGNEPGVRLACQLEVVQPTERVVLRVVDA